MIVDMGRFNIVVRFGNHLSDCFGTFFSGVSREVGHPFGKVLHAGVIGCSGDIQREGVGIVHLQQVPLFRAFHHSYISSVGNGFHLGGEADSTRVSLLVLPGNLPVEQQPVISQFPGFGVLCSFQGHGKVDATLLVGRNPHHDHVIGCRGEIFALVVYPAGTIAHGGNRCGKIQCPHVIACVQFRGVKPQLSQRLVRFNPRWGCPSWWLRPA